MVQTLNGEIFPHFKERLITVLSMLKGFVVHGVSMAVTEFLLNNGEEQRLKIVRWLVNGDDVLKCIKEIDAKMADVGK